MFSRFLPCTVILWSLVGRPACGADEATFQIDAKIPGGNIIVERIAGDDAYVRQDLRDTAGHWFYWHFRVRGAQGRTVTFHFTKGNVIGVRGPAFSSDGGKNWEWLGAKSVRGASFSFAFPADAREVRFCFSIPYTESNLRDFLKRYEGSPHLKVETLGKSKKGRDVLALRVGRVDGKARFRVALTCRHHACETMASFVLEGIIDSILADTPEGKWLRENVEFFIIPIVDGDGVEDGDQGKNRQPYDHNRDYEGTSIYPQVQAIRERLPLWSQGKLRFALDMHCPSIKDQAIYFVGGPNEKVWNEVGRFCKIVEAVQSGPLVYHTEDNMPIGKGWNTKETSANTKAFARWAAELPGVVAATTLEMPYATAGGSAVTEQSAHAFGRDLAVALQKYLDADSGGRGPSPD